MTRLGIDLAWARPSVAQIKATGATWVARYFSNDDNKDLHAAEVHAYPAAGIDIVAVWESTAGRATAGRAAGIADAKNADGQRTAAGLPDNMPLHFAVDQQATWASVQPYFDGVISVIGLQRTGCYGGIDVINGAYAHGIRYLWQTVAWSHGQWSPHATIRQTGGTTLGGTADWDTAMVTDFGQYPRPVTPQEQDMTPQEHQWLADLHAALTPAMGWDYANKNERKANPKSPDAWGKLTEILAAVKAGAPVALTDTQVAALAQALATNPAFVSAFATAVVDLEAKRLQS